MAQYNIGLASSAYKNHIKRANDEYLWLYFISYFSLRRAADKEATMCGTARIACFILFFSSRKLFCLNIKMKLVCKRIYCVLALKSK